MKQADHAARPQDLTDYVQVTLQVHRSLDSEELDRRIRQHSRNGLNIISVGMIEGDIGADLAPGHVMVDVLDHGAFGSFLVDVHGEEDIDVLTFDDRAAPLRTGA